MALSRRRLSDSSSPPRREGEYRYCSIAATATGQHHSGTRPPHGHGRRRRPAARRRNRQLRADARFCSSTASRSPGSPGGARCAPIWRTTTGWWRWISAGTVGPTSPRAGYADAALWAEDIAAVLRELTLEQPVLCGWSYGTIVILDYLREFGEDAIAGIGIVGGITKLGSDEALAALTPEMLGPRARLLRERDGRKRPQPHRDCCACASSSNPRRRISTPCWATTSPCRRPCARRCSRATVDNDDLLPTIRKPVWWSTAPRTRSSSLPSSTSTRRRHRPRAGPRDARRSGTRRSGRTRRRSTGTCARSAKACSANSSGALPAVAAVGGGGAHHRRAAVGDPRGGRGRRRRPSARGRSTPLPRRSACRADASAAERAADRVSRRRPSGPVRVGPSSANEAAMPPQDRVGGDEADIKYSNRNDTP